MALPIILAANNAGTRLAAAITNSQTTLTVTPGTGALFPSPAAGQYFVITQVDATTGLLREIMHCTSRTSDTLTVTRGQEGTTASAYNIYDPLANLWTAGQFNAFVQNIILSDSLGGVSAIQPYPGNPNGNVAGNAVSGSIPPSMVWDTVDSLLWVCTSTGSTSTAVWIRPGSTTGTQYCGTSTGTANAQILTPAPVLPAYVAGVSLAFVAGFTNTGALTVNVSGLGAKNVYKEGPTGPTALTGGEVVAGNILTIRYDGTRFQLTATGLGTAALANASSNTGTLAAVSGATTAGHIPLFSDTAGTVAEGPVPSSSTGTLAAVSGSITAGHLATFSDTLGTIADGGVLPAFGGLIISTSGTYLPGIYYVDTSGGAITMTLNASLAGAYVIIDAMNYWGTNNLTINGNGHNIGNVSTNVAASFTADVSDYQLSIEAASTYWRLV